MYLTNYNRRKNKKNYMIDKLKEECFSNEKRIESNSLILTKEFGKTTRFKANNK